MRLLVLESVIEMAFIKNEAKIMNEMNWNNADNHTLKYNTFIISIMVKYIVCGFILINANSMFASNKLKIINNKFLAHRDTVELNLLQLNCRAELINTKAIMYANSFYFPKLLIPKDDSPIKNLRIKILNKNSRLGRKREWSCQYELEDIIFEAKDNGSYECYIVINEKRGNYKEFKLTLNIVGTHMLYIDIRRRRKISGSWLYFGDGVHMIINNKISRKYPVYAKLAKTSHSTFNKLRSNEDQQKFYLSALKNYCYRDICFGYNDYPNLISSFGSKPSHLYEFGGYMKIDPTLYKIENSSNNYQIVSYTIWYLAFNHDGYKIDYDKEFFMKSKFQKDFTSVFGVILPKRYKYKGFEGMTESRDIILGPNETAIFPVLLPPDTLYGYSYSDIFIDTVYEVSQTIYDAIYSFQKEELESYNYFSDQKLDLFQPKLKQEIDLLIKNDFGNFLWKYSYPFREFLLTKNDVAVSQRKFQNFTIDELYSICK